jgi:hypothetical protein
MTSRMYEYTCPKTGKKFTIPFYSTVSLPVLMGCPPRFPDAKVPEVCRKCDPYKTRKDAGFG